MSDCEDNAEVYLALSQELIAALKRLSFAAQISGGTSGQDKNLMEAIAQAESALSLSAVSRAIDKAEQAKPCQEARRQFEPVRIAAPNDTARNGPGAVTTYHCHGCNYLQTEDWSESVDGELESGTYAKCTKADKSMGAYYSQYQRIPGWCPLKDGRTPTSAVISDERHSQ